MSTPFSLTRAMTTEEGVYGLILVSGLIAAAGSAGAPAAKTLLFVVVTVLVFWVAHVYSAAVAAHGTPDPAGDPVSFRAATRRAIRKSRGLLAATVAPALALILGATGILTSRSATWLALWVCVTVLAVLGYLAYARKGARIWVRLVGALSTASFGVVIIIAKAIVTH